MKINQSFSHGARHIFGKTNEEKWTCLPHHIGNLANACGGDHAPDREAQESATRAERHDGRAVVAAVGVGSHTDENHQEGAEREHVGIFDFRFSIDDLGYSRAGARGGGA